MTDFPGKPSGGTFTVEALIGPIAKRNKSAKNALLDFTVYNERSDKSTKNVKAVWSQARTMGLGESPGLQPNLDPSAVSAPLAIAGAQVIADKIRGITRPISENTRRYRATVARAYTRGAPWALARYGSRAPGASGKETLFNDSGELAALVRPRLNAANEWVIETVVAGVRNRFVVTALLRKEIPEMRSAKELAKEPAVKAALGDALRVAIGRPLRTAFGKSSRGGRTQGVRK